MDTKPTYTIQNVVASANLFVKVPLEKVAKKLVNTEYNPEQFPGLVIRLEKPKISALIFSSGRIVVTGAKSKAMVEDAVEEIKKELRKVEINATKKSEINIQNVVASGDIGMTLNLNKLAFQLETSEYEPEQFPGLVYKVPNSHITFLLFGTGRIVCTGAKTKTEVQKEVEKLVKTLQKFVK